MLRSCPLFTHVDRKLVAVLCVVLKAEIYLPSQFIRVAGHLNRAMYFIERGRVQLIKRIPKHDEPSDQTPVRRDSISSLCETEEATFKITECDTHFDMLSLFVDTPNFSVRSMTHTDCFRCVWLQSSFAASIRVYVAFPERKCLLQTYE